MDLFIHIVLGMWADISLSVPKNAPKRYAKMRVEEKKTEAPSKVRDIHGRAGTLVQAFNTTNLLFDRQMEICIDSIESARNAILGGATRLEACSSLSEGGLTPSLGLIKYIKEHSQGKTKLYAMLRIRSGNFVYSREEMDAMLYDLKMLKDHEVDGFVFGALREDASIDSDYCREIVTAAKPKPVTFHRAFDEAVYPLKSLETIIDLGFERILTSGQRDRATEGLVLIKRLIDRADERIVVMPGGGINPSNIEAVKRHTGAKEFHASAKKLVETTGGANKIKIGRTDAGHHLMITSDELVKQMVELIGKP